MNIETLYSNTYCLLLMTISVIISLFYYEYVVKYSILWRKHCCTTITLNSWLDFWKNTKCSCVISVRISFSAINVKKDCYFCKRDYSISLFKGWVSYMYIYNATSLSSLTTPSLNYYIRQPTSREITNKQFIHIIHRHYSLQCRTIWWDTKVL